MSKVILRSQEKGIELSEESPGYAVRTFSPETGKFLSKTLFLSFKCARDFYNRRGGGDSARAVLQRQYRRG